MDDATRTALLTPAESLHQVYEVGLVIGRGGFATVRRGRKLANNAHVALKILNPRAFSTPATKLAAFREIQVLRAVHELHHPNLIDFDGAVEDYSTTTQSRRLTIATGLASGGELFDRITKAGHYSEREAASFVRKLADALRVVHAAGIVHRDLKPENVLYASEAPDAEPLIADFGLARVATAAPEASLVGTPQYMAPEVITSRAYGPPCDVWALGVMTYILLCGYPPFASEGADNRLMYAQIAAGAYEFHADAWSAISPAAKDLVARMLTVDPARRATLDEVLAHPWIVHAATTGSATHLTRTIASLSAFNARRKLRAAARAAAWAGGWAPGTRGAALTALASAEQRLPQQALSHLGELFRAECTRTGGSAVTLPQFTALLAAAGAAHLPAARIFALFDVDESGSVDYKELALGLSHLSDSSSADALRFAFKIYDADDSGYLSRDELARMLAAAGRQDIAPAAGGAGPSAAGAAAAEPDDGSSYIVAVTDAIEGMDADRDGKISFTEFSNALARNAKLKAVVGGIVRQLSQKHME